MITVLLSPEALAGTEATVEGDDYRHLFRARRLSAGERLRTVDGEGRARWAEIAEVGRKSARLLLLSEPAPTHEPAARVELLVAMLRRERASWLVEKATELGVAAVRFLETERTVRELTPGTAARLERVAAAALVQCHGSRLPEITGPHPWTDLPALLAPLPDRRLLDTALDGEGEATFGPPAQPEQPAALLVGPEGGWSDAERTELRRQGCRPVSLGSRTLRVETAAVVGAGLLLAQPGPIFPETSPHDPLMS